VLHLTTVEGLYRVAMHFPEAPRIREAEGHDLDAILDVLGDAFEDDPVMRWVTPKASYARYAFELTVPFCLGHGHTYIANDGSGAAAWLPPGVRLASPVSPGVVWHGLREYGPGSLARALATLVQSQKRHPKDDYYYLFTIGALRSARGRGVGSALMREGLARCDEARMPAYLESSNVKNLPFYRKHGFEVVDELRLALNGPTLWLMWRPAR
jgi:ribosomal protein S18 acetylase RimI-like enzyme